MKLPIVLASLFVAANAYAQAPGDYDGEGEGDGYDETVAAPGTVAPVVAPVPAPAPPPIRRWSIGLGFGSMNLAPHTNPEAESQFGMGQLAVRYLATRHLEIELAVGGGREQLEDGIEGDREVNQAVLALRYRFAPLRRWNWWLMAGMGSLAVTHHDAMKAEREQAEQSTMQFGVGLERRWSRFALQLELRAVGVKAHDVEDAPVAGTVSPTGEMKTPDQPLPPVDTTQSAHDGMAGGQMIISGNYYF